MSQSKDSASTRSYPFFFVAPAVLFGLVLCFFVLHALQDIFVPLAMACILAVLLNPLSRKLELIFPRGIAIMCSIIIALLILGGILYFLSRQIATFSESLPALKLKFLSLSAELGRWVYGNFGIATDKQMEMLKAELQNSTDYLGKTLSTILGLAAVALIIPIYVFFLLLYKPLILDFLFHAFSEKHSERVAEILSETKSAVQSFMVGLMIETLVVAVMNSTALLLLGVRSAILIGVIGGILNIIPYLGGMVAIALPVLMAMVSGASYTTIVAIFLSYTVIQFIDNNVLVPRIVSSKVKINALISIVIVLMGGALWGVSGMFLSIPFVAILKIIFDRVDGLKPWGMLLGDKMPEGQTGIRWNPAIDRIFRRGSR